jgi:hypothetical protein
MIRKYDTLFFGGGKNAGQTKRVVRPIGVRLRENSF